MPGHVAYAQEIAPLLKCPHFQFINWEICLEGSVAFTFWHSSHKAELKVRLSLPGYKVGEAIPVSIPEVNPISQWTWEN